MEYMDIERVQHELREVLSLWTKIRTEPSCLHNSSVTIFTDFTNPQAGELFQSWSVGASFQGLRSLK